MLVVTGATHDLEGSLYGVSATDPITFVGVIVVLFAVALIAQGIPIARDARRSRRRAAAGMTTMVRDLPILSVPG